jgi:hypothetical protein
MLEREHPAPGRAEQMDPAKAELRAHRIHLCSENGHRPLDVLRTVRASTADLVVEDDRLLGRESFERGEVVMRGAGPTVQCKEWRGP